MMVCYNLRDRGRGTLRLWLINARACRTSSACDAVRPQATRCHPPLTVDTEAFFTWKTFHTTVQQIVLYDIHTFYTVDSNPKTYTFTIDKVSTVDSTILRCVTNFITMVNC